MSTPIYVQHRVCRILADVVGLFPIRRYCLEEPESAYRAFENAVPPHPRLPDHLTAVDDGLTPDDRRTADTRYFWKLVRWAEYATLQELVFDEVGMQWRRDSRRDQVDANPVVRRSRPPSSLLTTMTFSHSGQLEPNVPNPQSPSHLLLLDVQAPPRVEIPQCPTFPPPTQIKVMKTTGLKIGTKLKASFDTSPDQMTR